MKEMVILLREETISVIPIVKNLSANILYNN